MAVRTDIQYVQFYVDGSTARKPEQRTQAKHAAAPKYRRVKRKVVVVDPVAILGTVVTVCLLVAMLVRKIARIRHEKLRCRIYVEGKRL